MKKLAALVSLFSFVMLVGCTSSFCPTPCEQPCPTPCYKGEMR